MCVLVDLQRDLQRWWRTMCGATTKNNARGTRMNSSGLPLVKRETHVNSLWCLCCQHVPLRVHVHVQTDARNLPPDPETGARWFEAGVPTAEEGHDDTRTACLLTLLGQRRQRHKPCQADIGTTTLAKDVSNALLKVTRDGQKGVVISDCKTRQKCTQVQSSRQKDQRRMHGRVARGRDAVDQDADVRAPLHER